MLGVFFFVIFVLIVCSVVILVFEICLVVI